MDKTFHTITLVGAEKVPRTGQHQNTQQGERGYVPHAYPYHQYPSRRNRNERQRRAEVGL